MEKLLEVKDLVISFKTSQGILRAIRGINFDLYKGETLAIVGESGSGKSVTAKAIMGILAKNSIHEQGSILFRGYNLMQIPETKFVELRGTHLAMIFQDPMSSLNPIMKIGKQIAEVLILKQGMGKAQARQKALELMREVGIDRVETRYTQYPFQFSGGMRQRIVIAIALAADAELLICDEPTTALDVTIQAQILELIESIKIKRNLTVIFITHDLGVVARISDRVAVMYAGKIVEIGNKEEVFYNPQHPYTWALLASSPTKETQGKLDAIPGTPPNLVNPVVGDAFAPRNKYALKIDFEEEPPMFKISDSHQAATWLLHPDAPKVTPPQAVLDLQADRRKNHVKRST